MSTKPFSVCLTFEQRARLERAVGDVKDLHLWRVSDPACRAEESAMPS